MERAETDPSECAESDCATECAEADCAEPAAVRLHVPWAENRAVCPAHARVLAQQDGVVAEPLDDGTDWP